MFWQLLLDGMLLSTAALARAVPLAWAIIRVITASLMFATAKSPSVTPDAHVLASTVLLTVSIGLAIGVVSAWEEMSEWLSAYAAKPLRRDIAP